MFLLDLLPILNFVVPVLGQHFLKVTSAETQHPLEALCREPLQCPAEKVVTSSGTFFFPASNASVDGNIVKVGCQYGPKITGAEVIFEIPEDTGPKNIVTEGAERICYLMFDKDNGCYGKWVVVSSESRCREKNAVDTTEKVRTLLITPQTITSYNVRQAKPIMLSLLNHAVGDYESAKILIEGISRILETSEIFMSEPEDPIMNAIKEDLLKIIKDYMEYVKLKPGERVSLETTNMKVESVLFPPNIVPVSSYKFQSLQLSNEAISMARQSTAKGEVRLQMTAYGNDLFYHWGDERDWNTKSPSDNETSSSDDGFQGKWRITSLYFNGAEVQNLTDPIHYNLQVKAPAGESKRWVCVFWDPKAKKWSTKGMRTINLKNSIRCESTHLTAFSVLLDPIPMGIPGVNGTTISSVHLHILSVLSSVGSALSITGLAITTLTYGLFRSMRKERSSKILLHLSLSLLFLHLISMSSNKKMWDGYCAFPALLLHYFLLTSMAWMLVEGLNMYQLLISVFVKPETRFLLKRMIGAYGLPFVIVGVSAGIDIDAYNDGREEECVMGGHMPLYLITYLSPATIILAINTFIFIRIIQVLCKQSSRTKQQQFGKPSPSFYSSGGNDKTNPDLSSCNKFAKSSSSSPHLLSPVQIKGAITVMFLLGVGWILGLLAIGPFQLLFRYLFIIFNGGQGVFIFLFRVALHPQACRTWRRAILGSYSMESDAFSSGTGTRRGQSRPSFSVSPTFVSGGSSSSSSVQNSLTRSDPMSAKLAHALASFIQQNSISEDNSTTKDKDVQKHF